LSQTARNTEATTIAHQSDEADERAHCDTRNARPALDAEADLNQRDSVRYQVLRRHARWLVGGLLAACGMTLLVVGSSSGVSLSLDQQGTGCRGFWGETIQTVAWSRGGDYLAVASTSGDGSGITRVFEWPGMALRSRAATDIGGDYAAIAEDGTIYWTTWDPFSPAPASTTLWKQTVGGSSQALGPIADGRYLWLSWADGSLVAVERRLDPEATRLVRLSVADPATEPAPLTDWQERAGDLWISRDGDWTAWIEPNVPSDDPDEIVVRYAGNESRLTLPGYGGRVATLTPDREATVYQRSETARLTVVGLSSGTILGELDDRQFYGGEISARGILAAPTAHGPWQTNDLCVLDVGPRLAELAQSPSSPAPSLSLPPEQTAGRDALVRAARAGGLARLDALVPGDWTLGTTFHSYDDNVTARDALDLPFDLEGASRSLGGSDGTIFVFTGDSGVFAWFAVAATDLDVSFAGGGFGRSEATFRVLPGDPPVLDSGG
jgi:hypothetical protein